MRYVRRRGGLGALPLVFGGGAGAAAFGSPEAIVGGMVIGAVVEGDKNRRRRRKRRNAAVAAASAAAEAKRNAIAQAYAQAGSEFDFLLADAKLVISEAKSSLESTSKLVIELGYQERFGTALSSLVGRVQKAESLIATTPVPSGGVVETVEDGESLLASVKAGSLAIARAGKMVRGVPGTTMAIWSAAMAQEKKDRDRKARRALVEERRRADRAHSDRMRQIRRAPSGFAGLGEFSVRSSSWRRGARGALSAMESAGLVEASGKQDLEYGYEEIAKVLSQDEDGSLELDGIRRADRARQAALRALGVPRSLARTGDDHDKITAYQDLLNSAANYLADRGREIENEGSDWRKTAVLSLDDGAPAARPEPAPRPPAGADPRRASPVARPKPTVSPGGGAIDPASRDRALLALSQRAAPLDIQGGVSAGTVVGLALAGAVSVGLLVFAIRR